MDRRRMDAADGGRVLHRGRRVRKLAVVVALQNLLVAACLLVTLYVYRDVSQGVNRDVSQGVNRGDHDSEDNIHIQFVPIADVPGNKKLMFHEIESSNKMGLVAKKNDTIGINCTGPYILYMEVCYKGMNQPKEAHGTLELRVEGSNTSVSSVNLTASHEVCRGLHSIAYLRANERASLHLNCTDDFKVKNVTVGLSYLLGSQCRY
ncbi:uncharacterized protein LOC127350762 [Dicentrarchus labrax]|uniref:uncharacterized protein LOC127350762 n=1 Tax=Dicentrarchus labrax TaxID=13489 RepID=UPI0021F5533F|nr:uncharacterized protein LOC127350762 [Dicentrarchus labrax]